MSLGLSLPPTALVRGQPSTPSCPSGPTGGPVESLSGGGYEGEKRGFEVWGQVESSHGFIVLLTKLGDGFTGFITLVPLPLYMLENVHEEKLRLKIAL